MPALALRSAATRDTEVGHAWERWYSRRGVGHLWRLHRTPSARLERAEAILDSRGLGALVATRGRLERSNRRMALVLSNRSVLRILQITHFDELFEIYPSLRAAVDRDGNGNGNGLEAGTHEDPGRPT